MCCNRKMQLHSRTESSPYMLCTLSAIKTDNSISDADARIASAYPEWSCFGAENMKMMTV